MNGIWTWLSAIAFCSSIGGGATEAGVGGDGWATSAMIGVMGFVCEQAAKLAASAKAIRGRFIACTRCILICLG